jgi:hypothetical protein
MGRYAGDHRCWHSRGCNSFDILNFVSETGTFTTLNLPTLTGGDTGSVSYNATDLVITVEGPAVSRAQLLPLQRIEYPERSGDRSTASTHEPTAILLRVTCLAAAMIGSASCGEKASVVTASHRGDLHEDASVRIGPASVHNNVMVATRSISSGRGSASHEHLPPLQRWPGFMSVPICVPPSVTLWVVTNARAPHVKHGLTEVREHVANIAPTRTVNRETKLFGDRSSWQRFLSCHRDAVWAGESALEARIGSMYGIKILAEL